MLTFLYIWVTKPQGLVNVLLVNVLTRFGRSLQQLWILVHHSRQQKLWKSIWRFKHLGFKEKYYNHRLFSWISHFSTGYSACIMFFFCYKLPQKHWKHVLSNLNREDKWKNHRDKGFKRWTDYKKKCPINVLLLRMREILF